MARHYYSAAFGTILMCMAGAASADVAEIAADCEGCHGTDGVSEWADVPTIAGISEFVLSDALFYYRDDARPCEESEYRAGDTSRPPTDMCAVAKALSEDEIDAISAHFAALPFRPASQDFDSGLASAGKSLHDQECENCHADSGRDPEEDASILAGQQMEYMRAQFEDYLADQREQPEKMKIKIDALSADGVEALLHFYASLQ